MNRPRFGFEAPRGCLGMPRWQHMGATLLPVACVHAVTKPMATMCPLPPTYVSCPCVCVSMGKNNPSMTIKTLNLKRKIKLRSVRLPWSALFAHARFRSVFSDQFCNCKACLLRVWAKCRTVCARQIWRLACDPQDLVPSSLTGIFRTCSSGDHWYDWDLPLFLEM